MAGEISRRPLQDASIDLSDRQSHISLVRPGAVDDILANRTQIPFKDGYPSMARKLESKFAVAMVLIEDGRFDDQLFLLQTFIPSASIMASLGESERQKAQEEIDTLGVQLKHQIAIELIKRDKLSLKSKEGRETQQYLKQQYEADPLVQDLVGEHWPIEVVGQIALVDTFAQISDQKKLEELRSWVTRSLLSQYVGLTRGKKRQMEISTYDLIDRLPTDIFRNIDGTKYNLVQHWLEQEFMKDITDVGLALGMEKMETMLERIDDPVKHEYVRVLHERFLDIQTEPDQPEFHPAIEVKNRKIPTFSFEQLAFGYDYTHYGTRLLTAQTGLGKTRTVFKVLKKSEVEHALIIAPANGRKSWIDEEEKVFKNPGDIYSVEGHEDMLRLYIGTHVAKPDPTEDFATFRGNVTEHVAAVCGKAYPEEEIETVLWELGYITDTTKSQQLIRRRNGNGTYGSVLKSFTVIGHELLERAESDPHVYTMLTEVIKTTGMTGGAIDEIANFSKLRNVSTRKALEVLDLLRENFVRANLGKQAHEAPIVGVTATPLKSDLADLNVPMAMLYPHLYVPEKGLGTGDKQTFKDTSVGHPELAHIKLVGERQMFRWERASGVQEFEQERYYLTPSPFEEYLYNFLVDEIGAGNLEKFALLSDSLLNPNLIKKDVYADRDAGEKIPKYDRAKTISNLKEALAEWKHLQRISEPQDELDFLSANRLVELGYGDDVLACFFSDLPNGIDSLVGEIIKDSMDPELLEFGKFWMSREMSTKFEAVKKNLLDALTWKQDEDGYWHRSKVKIVTEERTQGRTQNKKQVTQTDEDGETIELYSESELISLADETLLKLIKQWVEDAGLCTAEEVGMIDGSVPIGPKRNAVINKWQNDPNFAVLFVSRPACFQSRDMTLREIVDDQERYIDGLLQISLGPDWNHANEQQMAGRELRHGMIVPGRYIVLVMKGTFDEAKHENVRFTKVLTRMTLSGIKPESEEKEILESRFKKKNLPYQPKEVRFLREALAKVTGLGEEAIKEFGNTIEIDQIKNNFQRLAERFFDNGNDAYHTSGYNADMVAKLINQLGLVDTPILSVGAGTLLLQRKLERGIVNVDINPHMMQAGWEAAKEYGGEMIQGTASALPEDRFPDGSFHVIDNAFAMHWSKLSEKKAKDKMDSERVKILLETHRLLTNDGTGRFILTLPEDAFDRDGKSFAAFTKALERHFGFTVDMQYSGQTYAKNKYGKTKRIGWSIVATKTGNVDLTYLDIKTLAFEKDKEEWESNGKKDKQNVNTKLRTDNYPSPILKIDFDEYTVLNIFGEGALITGLAETVENTIFVSENRNDSKSLSKEVINDDFDMGINGQKDLPSEFDISPPEDQISMVRGVDDAAYKYAYRPVLRYISRVTGMNMGQADQYCMQLIQERVDHGKPFHSAAAAYEYLQRAARRGIR